jgi:hypothetical protein
LTTLISDVAITPEAPIAPKKHTLLPLLTVLFMVSYGLMTMLIVEQGATIESQRGLIREMLHDSLELSSMKGKAIQEKNVTDTHRARTQAQVPMTRTPSTPTPLTQAPTKQTPSTQVPVTQTPSSQVSPSRASKARKPSFQPPSRPASDLADERRAVNSI